MNIADLVLRHADQRGSDEAVSEFPSDKRRTFLELADRVTRLAAGFQNSLGLKRRDSIAVLSRNRIEFMEIMLAAGRVGLCVQAMNWRLSKIELAEILRASAPSAVFYDPEYTAEAEYLADELPIKSWISWSEGKESSAYESLIAKEPSISDFGEPSEAGDDDPFLVVFTGGTTGVSKGAVHTHRSAFAAMANNVVGERIVPSDRFMLMGQMFHSPVLLAINYLTHGCPVVMVNFKADVALQCIEERGITTSMGIPTMYQNMLPLMTPGRWKLGSLRNLQYGGSQTGQNVIKEMYEKFGCSLIQCYGRTEELAITFLTQEDHVRAMQGINVHRLDSCGREAWLSKVMLIDSEGRRILRGSHQAGEIVVRSPGSMIGYLGRPDLTAEATYRKGWLKTGDLATMDTDGYYYVVDRAKDLIISGGENIYPAQVERAIQRHDDVLEVAVVGVADELWGESVKAYVVLKPGCSADAQAISQTAAKYLASYQKPKFVEFLDELPKTPAGKVEKRVLRNRTTQSGT